MSIPTAAAKTPGPTSRKPAAARTKLRPIQLFGYASGDAGNNLAFSMVSMFLLLYYTDVVGITAAAAGTIFLVVRIWDAFGDVIAGQLVDRTKSRWGKFRPWLLFASVPLLLTSVAVFSVPGGLSPGLTLLYCYVSYALLSFLYGLCNIPYGSLAATMTQVPEERGKLAMSRSMGSALTIVVLALVVAPQIRGSEDLQRSLTTTTLIFVGAGFLLYLFTFLTSREVVERDVEQVSLRDNLVTLRSNRALLQLCAAAAVFLVGMFSMQTMGIYLARDVLGNANHFIWLTMLGVGAMFAVAPLVPIVVRTVGKRTGFIAGALTTAVGGISLMLVPADPPAFAFACYLLMGIGNGLVNTLMWAMEADTVEYGEWVTNTRTEGTTYAVFSFVRKVGQAIGGAAAAYSLGFAGYIAGQEAQTEGALFGIRAAAGLLPAICCLIAVLIMLRYPLTEARFREIVEEVATRRTQRLVAEARGETGASDGRN